MTVEKHAYCRLVSGLPALRPLYGPGDFDPVLGLGRGQSLRGVSGMGQQANVGGIPASRGHGPTARPTSCMAPSADLWGCRRRHLLHWWCARRDQWRRPVKQTDQKKPTGSAPSHGTPGSDPTGSFARAGLELERSDFAVRRVPLIFAWK